MKLIDNFYYSRPSTANKCPLCFFFHFPYAAPILKVFVPTLPIGDVQQTKKSVKFHHWRRKCALLCLSEWQGCPTSHSGTVCNAVPIVDSILCQYCWRYDAHIALPLMPELAYKLRRADLKRKFRKYEKTRITHSSKARGPYPSITTTFYFP